MDWTHPQLLWLILPLSLTWLALALFSRSRQRRAAAAFVAAGMRPRILPADSSVRFWLKTFLWEMGLICSLIALAGPRFGVYYEYVKPRGADLYVAIDVSRSMLATDVLPSRLGRAKADVSDLLQHLNGERVALLAFAGKAAVRCPLTTDYGYFRSALNELDPNSAPRGGTAIGDAIRKALEVLPQDPSRDQAILLITDGDDHESYPEQAAEQAAERHVAIFAVGLGDDKDGAPVPKAKDAGAYMEYNGQQVRSKLDNELLKKIALLTGGVYVPAGTRQYNLGELYDSHLVRLRADQAKEEKRQRRKEQYQLFLALAALAFVLELLINRYPRAVSESVAQLASRTSVGLASGSRKKKVPVASLLLVAAIGIAALECRAAEEPKAAPAAKDDQAKKDTPPAAAGKSDGLPLYDGSPRAAVKEGLAAYRDDKFDLARQRFAQASALLKKKDRESLDASIAAFDLACALHQKDSREQAQSEYLSAGLARDKDLSAAAHYNLGCLNAEQARNLAGEDPLKLEPAKRTEVVDKLKEAAQCFRRCLDIEPEHGAARRNLELVRQWVKYWSDKWRELDREKRRKESPLLEYLEYLIVTEKALHEQVSHYKPTTPFDTFIEAKRLQTELYEEIDPLKDRMKDELAPHVGPANPGNPLAPQPKLSEKEEKKKAEAEQRQMEAVKLLLSWVDTAGQKMKSAVEDLGGRKSEPAALAQKAAAVELERVWEALIPFQPLLQRELADQTGVVGALAPQTAETTDEKPATSAPQDPVKKDEPKKEAKAETPVYPELDDDETARLAEVEETAGRRAMLLKLKADQELKRLESQPEAAQPAQPAQPSQPGGPTAVQPGQPDPEKMKEGYRKAIELAPKAAEEMATATDALHAKELAKAHPHAEEARKILEEIAKAFKQDQQKQDEQKKDQQKQDQKDQQKQDEQKKDQEQKQQEQKQQLSKDRMEAVLRQVREREKLKEKYDKEMKAYLMGPNNKVEKDW